MYVDKEVAKRMIDETPGMIWIDSFNGMTFIHTRPRQITVDEGKRIINKANTINYQDNDFFGLLSLDGVQEFMVHNIKFPQIVSWLWDTVHIIIKKNEQEIEQVFVLHLTQTYVWTMIIIVREIMEIKNSPNDVAATTYVIQTVTQPTKIKSLHILA